MSIPTSIILYVIVWFMMLFVVLPLRLKSQREAGDVVPGTPASAPADPQIKRRMIVVTLAASVVWVLVLAVLYSGVFSLENLGLATSYS